jgi:hypothetical protein
MRRTICARFPTFQKFLRILSPSDADAGLLEEVDTVEESNVDESALPKLEANFLLSEVNLQQGHQSCSSRRCRRSFCRGPEQHS